MASLAHLPFDCLYDVSSFLGLGSVRSLLLTCSSLHAQLTTSHNSMFLWMTQLNDFLVTEIELLQKETAGMNNQNKNKRNKVICGLNRQLTNQEKLLIRFRSRMQRQRQTRIENGIHEEEEGKDETTHTTFSIYNCLKQLYFSGVVRRLKSQVKDIVERMKVAKSIRELFVLFEEAVKNNDLSVFKSSVVLENEEELRRIEHQEALLWNIKSHTISFLFYFLSAVFTLKEDLENSEDSISLVQRIIHILEQLVNKYRMSATGEGGFGQTPLSLAIKIQNLDILKAFIALYNQRIVRDKFAQSTMLFDPNKMRENALTHFMPLSIAIKECVHTDLIDLILDEVYEPNKKEMIEAVLNSRPVYSDHHFCSILDYDLSWIKSIISKYQIDMTTLSEDIFCYAVKANSSSTYELIQYCYSQGLRIRNIRKEERPLADDPFLSLLYKNGVQREEQEVMECMELLLTAGGELSYLPLFDRVVINSFSIKLYQFLAKNGADMNLAGFSSFPPLMNMISGANYARDSLTKARWLLECGADPTLFFRSNNLYYQNCYLSALRLAYHRFVLENHLPQILDPIIKLLAEYGVTKETEKPDPDGLTFDQWFEIAKTMFLE